MIPSTHEKILAILPVAGVVGALCLYGLAVAALRDGTEPYRLLNPYERAAKFSKFKPALEKYMHSKETLQRSNGQVATPTELQALSREAAVSGNPKHRQISLEAKNGGDWMHVYIWREDGTPPTEVCNFPVGSALARGNGWYDVMAQNIY